MQAKTRGGSPPPEAAGKKLKARSHLPLLQQEGALCPRMPPPEWIVRQTMQFNPREMQERQERKEEEEGTTKHAVFKDAWRRCVLL